jgi:hypothetical protein
VRDSIATVHVVAASEILKCRVFPQATLVSSIAQLCDARAEQLRALKPFVACRYLMIVIPL